MRGTGVRLSDVFNDMITQRAAIYCRSDTDVVLT